MNPLPTLSGERLDFDGAGQRLSCWVAGHGPPLLLVHSVNAAASAAEMRPLHAHFQRTHTVFSVDLPGFGQSERLPREHTPRQMTDALHALVALARQRCDGRAVDALALSLSCEFLARAAVEAPEHFRSLALVSPTGLAGRDHRRGPPGSVLGPAWALALLRGPGWGRWLFRGLTRPGVVRFFLEKTWGSRQIDEQLWRDAVAQARAPGAEHAPLSFIAGRLFSRDIQDVYERITTPAWLSHGVRGDFTDYRRQDLLAGRPNWRITAFATGAMPYFEQTGAFCAAYEDFLGSVA